MWLFFRQNGAEGFCQEEENLILRVLNIECELIENKNWREIIFLQIKRWHLKRCQTKLEVPIYPYPVLG
jgi:hypothetical protein